MTDLVVISLEVWDDVWRRNQHLIAGLLRSGVAKRVLFVEPPVDQLHEIRRGRRPVGSATGIRPIPLTGMPSGGELWALRPRKWLPRKLDSRGDRRRARDVVSAAQKIGLSRPVLWVNDPGGVEVLRESGWPALYDITDDWLLAERPVAEIDRLTRQEAALFEGAREVVVCSRQLQESKSKARSVVLIPNAVDVEAYRTLAPRPSDLPDGPVALYLGTAHRDRVDVGLCAATARLLAESDAASPRGSVVLVGPAPLPTVDLEALTSAGVHVLGSRPSEQVPAYLQNSDVLLVPHVLTEFTASLDPIKAYEYRAARRKVVSTPVSGFLDGVDPLVTVASPAEFPDAVAAAMADPIAWSPDLPSDIPSWADRVEQMAGVVREVAQSE